MGVGIENNLFADFVFFIPSGGTKSTKVYARGNPAAGSAAPNLRLCLVGIFIPAGFSGTGVSFETSFDGVTWVPVYGADGTQVAATVGAGQYVALSPAVMFGVGHIKLVGAAQAADTEVVGRFQAV
jgi:hypothetical protein